MIEGCEGCLVSNRGQKELLEITRVKAKKYAEENKKTVAIYREGYEISFCEADVATSGQFHVIEYISQYNNTPA